VRLDWGGVEWAAVGLRELEMQVMLLERRCQQGEGMRGRRDSKLDMARVRSRDRVHGIIRKTEVGDQ